jgi:hypothetical protein
LSATATQLRFNFGDMTSSLFNFASDNFSGGSGGLSLQFCDAAATSTNQNGARSNSEILLVLVALGCCSTSAPVAESGLITIGAASSTPTVPEPATWAMILVGFTGLGVFMHRSRKRLAATA